MFRSLTIDRAVPQRAVVSKLAASGSQYLQFSVNGAAQWVADPSAATAFESMREATRIAMRLPAGLRAFGMPLSAEQMDYEPATLH